MLTGGFGEAQPMEILMSKKKVSTQRGVKIATVLQVQRPAWEQRL
jgi:hypothetical protein